MKVRKNYRLESDVVKALELLVKKGIFKDETSAIEYMVKHYTRSKLNIVPVDPFEDWSRN